MYGAWFLEDAIKIRRNLTVELGIRHEFTSNWDEANGRAANYTLNSQGILNTAPLLGSSVYTQNNTPRLFGPRIGVAWDVFGTGRTAVRAGYGMYYSLIDDLAYLLNSLPPYNSAASCANVAILTIIPANSTNPSRLPALSARGSIPNAKTPSVQEWNLAIEQRLTPNTSLRVAYVGSFAVHELVSLDPNTIPATICENSGGCAAGGVTTLANLNNVVPMVPQGAQYIPGPGAKRPNPALASGFFLVYGRQQQLQRPAG